MSNRTLYDINRDFEKAMEFGYDPETGEIFADIESLQLERDEKIRNCACFVLNERAFIETLKAQKKAIESRIAEHERKADWVENMVKNVLDGEKVETDEFAIKYTTSKKTVITDASKIPMSFMRFTDPVPDLAAIKIAITKQGLTVPGAEVVESTNMKIK